VGVGDKGRHAAASFLVLLKRFEDQCSRHWICEQKGRRGSGAFGIGRPMPVGSSAPRRRLRVGGTERGTARAWAVASIWRTGSKVLKADVKALLRL